MGIGSLTELVRRVRPTSMRCCSASQRKLRASAILTTQVSAARARRARGRLGAPHHACGGLAPDAAQRGHDALMTVHASIRFRRAAGDRGDCRPVRDPNFRVRSRPVHVYNRDGLRLGRDPFELWPRLELEATRRTRSTWASERRARRSPGNWASGTGTSRWTGVARWSARRTGAPGRRRGCWREAGHARAYLRDRRHPCSPRARCTLRPWVCAMSATPRGADALQTVVAPRLARDQCAILR